MTGSRPGLTLVEVLVALAVAAVLAAAVAGSWSTSLRTTAAAERAAARARALEPHALPSAVAVDPPAACPSRPAAPGDGPCLASRTRCRVDPVRVTCGGTGPLVRLDLRLPPAVPDAEGEVLTVWARVRP